MSTDRDGAPPPADDAGPRRWTDLPAGDSADHRIGRLLRQVPPPVPLPPWRLERTATTLGRRPRGRSLPLRFAVTAAVVLGMAGAVFARHQLARLWRAVAPAPIAARAPERAAPAPIAARAPEPAAPVPPPEPMPPAPSAPPAESRAVEPPRPRPHRPHAVALHRGVARVDPSEVARAPTSAALSPPPTADHATPSTPAPAVPSPSSMPPPPSPTPASPAAPPRPGLGDEARLIARALQELRHGGDPQAALAALDEHRARFPHGLLRADADLVRVQALLALDRDRQALALLEGLDPPTSPRGDELQVIRGELRAARNCPGAVADFAAVLAREPPDPLAERAIWGRAVCRLRLADPAAAADLRMYLQRFPQGRFAREARARLSAPAP